jgi:glycosyltransferase involved in cell wall biosynthesis
MMSDLAKQMVAVLADHASQVDVSLKRIESEHGQYESLKVDESDFEFVFFLPWLLSENTENHPLFQIAKFLGEEGITTAVVTTLPDIESSAAAKSEWQNAGVMTASMSDYSGEKEFWLKVLELTSRPRVILCNVGSRWLYENLSEIKLANPSIVVFDLLYNHLGHIAPHFEKSRFIDVGLVQYQELKDVLSEANMKTEYHVIPFGVADLKKQHVRSNKEGPTALKVGWLGRLSPEKRPDLFLQVVKHMYKSIDVELVGRGPLYAQLLSEIEDSELDNVSILTEYSHDQVSKWLAELDVLVNTSSVEGVPLSFMESVRQGTPIVTFDVGGASSFVHLTGSGYILEDQNPEMMGKLINELFDDPEGLNELKSKISSSELHPNFRIDSTCASWKNLIEHWQTKQRPNSRSCF